MQRRTGAAGRAGIGRAPAERARAPVARARLLIAGANALRPLKGFNAPETVSALIAAKELTDAGVGLLRSISALHGLCSARHSGAQIELALALAGEMLEVARRQDDPTFDVMEIASSAGCGLKSVKIAMHWRRFAKPSGTPSRIAEAIRLSVRKRSRPERPGLQDLGVGDIGLPREAAKARARVLAGLQSQEHSPTVGGCIHWAKVWPHLLWGDLESLERNADELVAYCNEKEKEAFRALGAVHGAFARAMRDPGPERASAVDEAIAAWHRSGARAFDSVHISQLAESFLMADDVPRAEGALREAFSFVEQSGDDSGSPSCIASTAGSRSSAVRRIAPGRKLVFSVRSISHAAKRPGCSSFAQ